MNMVFDVMDIYELRVCIQKGGTDSLVLAVILRVPANRQLN